MSTHIVRQVMLVEPTRQFEDVEGNLNWSMWLFYSVLSWGSDSFGLASLFP